MSSFPIDLLFFDRHGTLLTEKQVQDYNCDIVSAVRTSDLATLRRLQREGKR